MIMWPKSKLLKKMKTPFPFSAEKAGAEPEESFQKSFVNQDRQHLHAARNHSATGPLVGSPLSWKDRKGLLWIRRQSRLFSDVEWLES